MSILSQFYPQTSGAASSGGGGDSGSAMAAEDFRSVVTGAWYDSAATAVNRPGTRSLTSAAIRFNSQLGGHSFAIAGVFKGIYVCTGGSRVDIQAGLHVTSTNQPRWLRKFEGDVFIGANIDTLNFVSGYFRGVTWYGTPLSLKDPFVALVNSAIMNSHEIANIEVMTSDFTAGTGPSGIFTAADLNAETQAHLNDMGTNFVIS